MPNTSANERATDPEGAPAEGKLFYHSTLDFLRDLPKTEKRFWVLVSITGLAAGLGAALLVEFLRLAQSLAWHPADTFLGAVTAASKLRRFLIPTAGGLLVVLASLLARRPLRGHGTAGIIESIWFKSGRMPFLRTFSRGAVSIVAVALGAPLGREGALLSTGAATGSSLAARFKVTPEQAKLLVACGASAGIAAAYNVPIGAALFGLEVLLGSFALELFGPIVLSCVVATFVSRILIADHPSYLIPSYDLLSRQELLIGVLLAPVLGIASALYVRVINSLSDLLERAPRKLGFLLPLGAMAMVGLAGVFLPQVLGNGYDSVNDALLGRLPLLLLLLLPFVKLGVTALAAGSGVPGGLFTPSLFYGALLGGALGHLVHALVPGAAPIGAYALLGMAAVLAGTTHASVSAVLIIFELTGSYHLILPLMLVTVIAAAVSRRIEPDSLYTAVLRRRKLVLPHAASSLLLKGAGVGKLMQKDPPTIAANTSFQDVIVRLLEIRAGVDLYVVDGDRKLLGALVLDSLKGHLPDHADLGMVVAADVMDAQLQPVTARMSLSEVAQRFSDTCLERLPVVDEERRLIGTISKGEVLRHGRF